MPDNVVSPTSVERVPHLAPQGVDVPAQRPASASGVFGEAMDFVNADEPGLEARQHGAPALGSEIERKIRFPGHSDRMI